MQQNNSFDNKALFKQVLIAILLIYVIFVKNAFSVIFEAFSLVIVSLVVVYILTPLVRSIQRKTKLKKSLSVLLAVIIAIAGTILFFVSIVPALADSIMMMARTLPPVIEEFTVKLSKIQMEDTIFGTNYNVSQVIDNIIIILTSYANVLIDMTLSGVASVASLLGMIFSSITTVIFVTMMSWYGLLEADNMLKQAKRFLYAVSKKGTANYIIHVGRVTDKVFKGYFISKAFICIILGVIIFISIALINGITNLYIPYAILFSIFLGITNFIPYVGPILGTIPCALITLFYGFPEALTFTILIIVLQQLESIFLTPMVMKGSLGVNEFVIVASAAVGSALFGLVGMVISIPVVATIQVLLSEYIEKKEREQQMLSS